MLVLPHVQNPASKRHHHATTTNHLDPIIRRTPSIEHLWRKIGPHMQHDVIYCILYCMICMMHTTTGSTTEFQVFVVPGTPEIRYDNLEAWVSSVLLITVRFLLQYRSEITQIAQASRLCTHTDRPEMINPIAAHLRYASPYLGRSPLDSRLRRSPWNLEHWKVTWFK